MTRNVNVLVSILVVSICLSACNPMMMVRQLTAEQMQMHQQMQMKMLQQMRGNNVFGQGQVQPAGNTSEPSISEAEMGEKINLIPEVNKGVEFIKRKDGFDFNGVRHIDPEGRITAYSCNPVTGDSTYFSSTSRGTVIIKRFRATSNTGPITIAKAHKQNDGWEVRTSTGKKINGQSLTPFSKGFLVGRDSTGFLYVPGNEIIPISCPDGFAIAEFQNGDVSETGYILVEKIAVPESNTLGSLVSKTKNLGAAFGINKKEDYLLFNYHTKKQIPINVSLEGKDVAVYSGSVKSRKGGLMKEYSQVDFFESLYDKKTGLRNGGHYYWRINWFKTDSGPILIVSESGAPRVTVHNLLTGKKSVLFERLLGINWVVADKKSDGKIQVKAKLGFSTKVVEDTELFLNGSSL